MKKHGKLVALIFGIIGIGCAAAWGLSAAAYVEQEAAKSARVAASQALPPYCFNAH